MAMETFVIIRDKLSDREVPRQVEAAKAQEALAIEFGVHFVRLMNEEKDEAEVQVVRASLIDGIVKPKNNRYQVHCYRRDDGTPYKRYGGKAKTSKKWIGMTSKKILNDIKARMDYLEEKRDALENIKLEPDELERRQDEIDEELFALTKAARPLESYLQKG